MDDDELYSRLKIWTALWIICVVAAFVAGFLVSHMPNREDADFCVGQLQYASQSVSTHKSAADEMSHLLGECWRNQTQYRQIAGMEVTLELCKEHCAGLGLEYGRHEPRYCYCITEFGAYWQQPLGLIKNSEVKTWVR